MKKSMTFLLATMLTLSYAEVQKPNEKQFYVYKDRGSRLNHYIPSGWMGDTGDLKYQPGYVFDPSKREETCIKITYTAERKQSQGWAGIYWQMPSNNWGDKKGGYDLSSYKKLSFKVKGEKGKEYIDKFIVGGITGQTESGDSDSTETQPIELTDKWETIEIDLKGMNLTHIIGGFGFAVNADFNEKGISFYIDDIYYTK